MHYLFKQLLPAFIHLSIFQSFNFDAQSEFFGSGQVMAHLTIGKVSVESKTHRTL